MTTPTNAEIIATLRKWLSSDDIARLAADRLEEAEAQLDEQGAFATKCVNKISRKRSKIHKLQAQLEAIAELPVVKKFEAGGIGELGNSEGEFVEYVKRSEVQAILEKE